MNSLKLVWKDTRMVVLTALSAALYAAILIPFKILPIIPGVTEIRPANAIPIVTSILFGPAGAWGSAFGNLIGDFFLGLGPGSLVGMVGNFLFGFVPYVFWRAMFGSALPESGKRSHWAWLMFVCVVASAACAFTIGWGIDVIIKGVPFAILGSIIFFNNFLMSAILAPPLLFALLPRVRRWGLLYTQILPEEATRRPRFAWVGVALMTLGSVGGLGGGLLVATGMYDQHLGVPKFFQAFRNVVAPAPITAPGSGVPPVHVAVKPAPSTAVATRTATGTAVPSGVAASPVPSHRLGLGLATLPGLALIALSMFFL
jgi:energy-coupling factor transport system substrate-specific component